WLLSLRPLLRCPYTDNASHWQDKENAIFWLVQIAQDFPGAFHQSIHQFFPFYHGEDGAMVVFLGAKEVAESGHQWRIVTKGCPAHRTQPRAVQDGDAGHFRFLPAIQNVRDLFKVINDQHNHVIHSCFLYAFMPSLSRSLLSKIRFDSASGSAPNVARNRGGVTKVATMTMNTAMENPASVKKPWERARAATMRPTSPRETMPTPNC